MQVNFNSTIRHGVQQNFKGNFSKTENGAEYYKTNKGLVAGNVLAALFGLDIVSCFAKGKPQTGLIALGVAASSIGCGAIIDNLRNKKAAEIADRINEIGLKNAIRENDRIEIARSGQGYYESNTGIKYGGLLGAGLGAISGALLSSSKEFKKNLEAQRQSLSLLGGIAGVAILYAIGGVIMGKIADHYTNKDARKHS